MLALFFVLGTIIGSFLNVVIYRLHTGRSLKGRSHCLSCGRDLAWYELIPLFSYLFLRGKCRHCASRIPSRYFVVELLTGISFVALAHTFLAYPVLLAFYLLLASVLIVIAVYDIRHTIIPDELSIAKGVLAFVFAGYKMYLTEDVAVILPLLLSGAGAGLFIGLLWYLSKGRWMGLGDAKLALPLGIIVGFPEVFSMIVLAFWIGALYAISLLAAQSFMQKGKTRLRYPLMPITMKSEVPFAPFLILGFLFVHFLHADVFDITFLLFL